jgi:hypothetical protein
MKKEIFSRVLLVSAVSSLFFTGCAMPRLGQAQVDVPAESNLAFVPVTHARVLSKWAQDFPHLRATETYRFIDPTPATPPRIAPAPGRVVQEDLPPGEYYVDVVGGERRYHRVIYHRPHTR